MKPKAYKTKDGCHPSTKINVLDTLPKTRFVAVLRRVRSAITKGRPLQACDDTTPGDKSTSCSWGLCHESAETWPDAQDHTFPADFEQHGRISPLGLSGRCPIDRRTPDNKDPNGCFYSCRVFSPKKGEPRITREVAIALYDQRIAEELK